MEKTKKNPVITLSILGESWVGKTCLCSAFFGLEFVNDSLATIGIEKLTKEMTMSDKNVVTIKIWDTAGQERFRSISIKTVRTSKGVIVVFDVTKKSTFEKVSDWIEKIKEVSEDIPIVLFGNKCDLENREVTKEEAQQFADKNGFLYFETSAKDNIGVKEGFEALAEKAYDKSGLSQGFKLKQQKTKKKKKGFCGGGKENKNK